MPTRVLDHASTLVPATRTSIYTCANQREEVEPLNLRHVRAMKNTTYHSRGVLPLFEFGVEECLSLTMGLVVPN